MNTNSSFPPPSAPYYQDPYLQQAPVMTIKDWILTFIVSAIPIVNIIMLFVWAFGDNTNPNKKNYAKASLILAAIFIVLYVVFLILFFVILGASGGMSRDNFF
ncbi:MAG: hypothetical protein K0S39_5807 [Paenibacillus sp.]|jgi:uncharacterized membrane-anchored protein YitT (DUF2179 family)|nr:hypothetical protein [Paenibacillus sp.]